jgi:putative tricarboxylic transport membrane protein
MAAPSRGALAVGGGVVLLGLVVLVGALWVRGEAAYAGVGPRAVPVLVGAGLTLAAAGFVLSVVRGARLDTAGTRVDRAAILWIAGSLAVAALVIERAGFAPAAALVFAATARAFGSRRALAAVAYGLALGIVVYVVFAHGLGVSLPGGPLDAVR